MKAKIKRTDFSDKQILGELQLSLSDKLIFSCKTLELPDKGNMKRVSCIPAGRYKVKKRWSEKYGKHFHILNVPNRDFILIHHGNFHYEILGCVLVGDRHSDINGDGYRDVTNSKKTMQKLLALTPEEFELTIE